MNDFLVMTPTMVRMEREDRAAREDLGEPTELVLAALTPHLTCLVAALVGTLDGDQAERVRKTRALFAVALDRIFDEVES